MNEDKFKKLILKIQKAKDSGTVDLSTEEDLAIAVMNLISLEEHLFFTSQKTQKDEYLDLLKQVREIRKELLGRMIDAHEGETWCITKHLLAGTMRLIEVGTKLQTDGKIEDAKKTFHQAYLLFSMFWALRLKLIDTKKLSKELKKEKAWSLQDLVTKMVDCCKE